MFVVCLITSLTLAQASWGAPSGNIGSGPRDTRRDVVFKPRQAPPVTARVQSHVVRQGVRAPQPDPARILTIAVPSMMASGPFRMQAPGLYRLIEAQLTQKDIADAAHAPDRTWFQIWVSTAIDIANACQASNLQVVAPDRKPTATSPSACGLDAGQGRDLLIWDRTHLGAAPLGWRDFWNIAQHPGKRALPCSARITLEVALLADGVAPRDIYRTLRSKKGQERAFRKLSQIRPYLTFWRTAREAAAILQSGGALMGVLPARAAILLHADRENSRYAYAPGSDLGESYNAAVIRRGDESEKNLAVWSLRYDPVRVSVPESLHLGRRPTLMIDDLFWSRHGAALQQRFQNWAPAR